MTIWVSTGKPKVAIPTDLVGQTWADASKELDRPRPETGAGTTSPGGKTKGIVTATDPAAGQSVTVGSTVTVNVAAGPAISARPERRRREPAARRRPTSTTPASTVNPTTSTTTSRRTRRLPGPAAGSRSSRRATNVKVSVSNGPPMTTVPNVVGETAAQAKHDLQAAGFKVVVQLRHGDRPGPGRHRPVAEPGRQLAGGRSTRP